MKDDVLIGISGSGNSPNVLRAVEYANEIGCRTIGLTTAQGGRLKDIVGLPLVIPSNHMGRLEDAFSSLRTSCAMPSSRTRFDFPSLERIYQVAAALRRAEEGRWSGDRRDYAAGDDYRAIDWAVCARRDELLTRPAPPLCPAVPLRVAGLLAEHVPGQPAQDRSGPARGGNGGLHVAGARRAAAGDDLRRGAGMLRRPGAVGIRCGPADRSGAVPGAISSRRLARPRRQGGCCISWPIKRRPTRRPPTSPGRPASFPAVGSRTARSWSLATSTIGPNAKQGLRPSPGPAIGWGSCSSMPRRAIHSAPECGIGRCRSRERRRNDNVLGGSSVPGLSLNSSARCVSTAPGGACRWCKWEIGGRRW